MFNEKNDKQSVWGECKVSIYAAMVPQSAETDRDKTD